MLAYMLKNKDWCSIPDEVIDQLKANHAKSLGFTAKACNVAVQIKKHAGAGGAGRRRGRTASPGVAGRPALSGGRRSLPAAAGRAPAKFILRHTPRRRCLTSSLRASTARSAGSCCSRRAGRAWRWPGWRMGRGPILWHLFLVTVGAIVMRGAGCAYNDILDRDLDAGVERTKGRPLPSGRVTVAQAFAFSIALSLVGLIILLQFNRFTIALSASSLLIVAVYPLAKRVTSWPQAVLGLAFSWGALVGWSATFASLSLAPILLYASAFCWTIGYDTIYALQDARDDAVVGIRSTARLFGTARGRWSPFSTPPPPRWRWRRFSARAAALRLRLAGAPSPRIWPGR